MERVAASKPFKGAYAKHKRALERLFDKARDLCRQQVYDRDGGCCVDCGVPLKLHPSEARHEFEIAHIDEVIPRSLGGDPLDVNNCRTRCYRCHAVKHGLRVAP